MIASLCAVLCFSGISPQEMKTIVADRLAALDKLDISLTADVYTTPPGSDPLERTRWKRTGSPLQFRMQLVRPNALVTGAREAPRYPDTSIVDGEQVARSAGLTPDDKTLYVVSPAGHRLGFRAWLPILSMFDVELRDCPVAQLNLLRLFEEHEVALINGSGGVSTYSVLLSHPSKNYDQLCEFDLNDRGTPLRFKLTNLYRHEGAQPGACELFTLGTSEVNGAQLCTEVVAVVANPYEPGHGVFHMRVTAVGCDPTLTKEGIRIEPIPRDAIITRVLADGSMQTSVYDGQGNLIGRARDPGGPKKFASREAVRMRALLPPLATLVGAMVALWFLRSSRT